MSSIVIDTNPLVYIYNNVSDLGERFAVLLGNLSRQRVLTVPKIVYGELSIMFNTINELDSFLDDTGIVIAEMNKDTYAEAAGRWQTYNKRRSLICHQCGAKLENLSCRKCGEPIKIRQHILTDFIIGACALDTGKAIVTSDAGYYKTYFPELNIITV